MTALPIHREQTTAPQEWVPIDVAAEALGTSEGNLRRKCNEQLQTKHQAKKILVDGTHKWHLHTSYSPRLRRISVETDDSGRSKIQELMETMPAEKIKQAQLLAQIVIEFRKFRTSTARTSFASFKKAMESKYGSCPGKTRLYDMDKNSPSSDDIEGIVYAVIDRRGRKKGDIQTCSEAAWKFFCDLYLHKNQRSLAKCWRHTREQAKVEGWAWPSERRIYQLVNERLDPSMVCLQREGQDAWNRKFLAPMEQDPNAWKVGQCWESDHMVFDFDVRVIKAGKWVRTRPQLTSWMDRRTRLITGYHVSEQGNQITIRAALLNALHNPEIARPEVVWLDNGKDFMAQSIGGLTKSERRSTPKEEREQNERAATGILGMLGITPHFAMPYNHDGKSRIERWHGTVHGEFDRDFMSYCGNKPGMLDSIALRDQRKDILSLPTLDEVREIFDEFIAWYNTRTEHRIDDLKDPDTLERLSPIQFYDRYLETKPVINKNALKLLEPMWSPKPLKVHKNGISLKIGGGTVRFGDTAVELEPFVGSDKRVYVSWDPEDTTQITVWDEDFKLVCTAMENKRYGGLASDKVTIADRRAGFAARRGQKRRAKQRADILTMTMDNAELASRETRKREVAETQAKLEAERKGRDPHDAPQLRLVRTRLDDAPDDIQEQKHRKAAGAEHYEDPENCGSIIEAARDQHLSEEAEFASSSLISADLDVEHDEFATGSLTDAEGFGFDTEEIDPDLRIMDHLR